MMRNTLTAKLRPRNLDDVVGQRIVIKAIKHSLNAQRLHQSYCFIGCRGTGKTTVARIFAKCLNCLGGITTKPCQCCTACQDVERDQRVDYIEIDAASHRGVEEMTSVLERSVHSPIISRFKIYVVDEAHMLTPQAFSAMLRILEEPPEHVKFILCSTELSKVPVTILSRTTNLYFNLVALWELEELIASALRKEDARFSSGVPLALSKIANGSARDALTCLDRLLMTSKGKLITVNTIVQSFGVPRDEFVLQVIRAIANRDTRVMSAILREINHQSYSFTGILCAVSVGLCELLSHQLSCTPVSHNFWGQGIVRELSVTLSHHATQMVYKILLSGLKQLKLSSDHQSTFGITMLRAILC